jgi:HAE1 family hydrophobic/amphiphilic exporter-1
MGVTRLAINRPIAILMIVAAFLVLGVVSYLRLPAELNPKVDFPVVSINTTYAGTNPQEMETLITKPIEDSISGVSGLKQIDSTSQSGVSVVRCTFYFGTNLDTASAEVRQKVDAVRKKLPINADSPSVAKQDNSSQPIMYIAMKGNRSPRELRVLADNVVSERLQQAPDVSAVNVFGGDQREIRVAVRSDRLAAYGVTIGQVAQAINNANQNVSAGYIQTSTQYASIRFLGEFTTVNELKDLRISLPSGGGATATAPTGGAGGGGAGGGGAAAPQAARVVRLADIADVTDTTVQRTQESTLDGLDSVTLAIQKTSDGNTLKATDGVREQLKAVTKFIPADVSFVVTRDDSKNVRDNLKDVVISLFLGALLAVLIVYLFLHNLRATVIVAIAIPTCIIATFLPIAAFGFTLNSLTLLGLSLAIGILIDDSIVVIENISRHLALGQEPREAAITGRSEIGLAALTLTAVDLVVFVPIAFMSGVIGEFFRSFGVSISVAVLISLFVSFTLTPMLASRWFQKGQSLESSGAGQRGFAGWFNRGYHKFEGFYRNLLRAFLRRPWIVVLAGNAVLVVAVILIFPKLGFRFAPGQDQNQVSVTVQAPAGTALPVTKGITDGIERRIRADKALTNDVEYLQTSVGRDASGGPGSGNTGTQYAQILVSLYDKAAPLDKMEFWNKHTGENRLRDEADSDVAKKIRALVKTVPGSGSSLKIQANEVNGFGGGGAPLTISMVGTDFTQLLKAAALVKGVVDRTPGTYGSDLSFKASQPEVQIRLDRVRAAQYALNVSDVATTVSAALQGNITAQYRDPKDSNQYNINVILADGNRNSIYTVGDIPVGYQNGSPVRLGDVANIGIGAGPTRVDRLNRLRQVSVTSFLAPGTQINNVRFKIDPQLKAMADAGKLGQVSYTWGGEAQTSADEFPYLIQAVLLGIILSYMLMAALFNNMLYPLSVMLTLPQALVGALAALLLTGTPFSLITAIGVIMLNGIATKNAILMVDYTNTLRARGYKRLDAILEAAPTRLRPVLMTSFAIVFATLPTAAALGRGAGFRQPLGITVVGGVIVSTFLTLLVIPSVYLLFDDFANWLGRVVWHRSIPAEALAYGGTDRDVAGRDGAGRGDRNGDDQDRPRDSGGPQGTRGGGRAPGAEPGPAADTAREPEALD